MPTVTHKATEDLRRAVKGLLPIPKVSFDETLGKFVLPSLCIGCGSCIVVCPFGCLEYVGGKPVLVKECKICGLCAQVCPKYELNMPALEKFVFGRERGIGEDFGIHRRIAIAQTRDEDVMKVSQDGGVITTLLIYALGNGFIDGAVLAGVSEKEPLRAIPKLATTKEEVIGCAGTRYTYSPNMLAFKEGILQKRKSLAFVGTPCQVRAVRKTQAIPLRKYSEVLSFTVGVFCSECFAYDGLANKLVRGKLGIDPREVKKINIKGRMIISTKSGEERTVPLKEAKKHASNCASSCPDFSAELADISTGGLGLNGWTYTILRTEIGEELFQKAETEGLIRTRPIEEEQRAYELLVSLSKKKRKNLADQDL